MTDALAVELLPKQSSTPYELANLGAMIEAWPIDPAEIERQSDPMRCDADMLPWLAFDKGVTLWSDGWPEAKQRRVIRDWWIYARLQGTPLGVEAMLNLADGVVIREVLPPADAFAMPDTGEVGHATLLALMPELRLYYHWPEKDFARTVAFADLACADRMFAYPDQGEALGRYPVLYDPATGIETPLDVVGYGEVGTDVVLSKRGYVGTAFYADFGCADVSFAGTPLVQDPITYSTEDPDLEMVRNSPPLAVWELAADHSYAGRTFAVPDVGDVGTYDRLSLFDPSRVPAGVTSLATAAFYADWSWLGLPAYHEILTVAVPGTPVAMPYAAFAADAGFALDADDQSSLALAVEAVAFAKRTGDRMLLDLAPTFAGTRAATLPAMSDI